MYGHDLANSRAQPAEDALNAANAGTLTKAWDGTIAGAALNGTPVVAGGCVYLLASKGASAYIRAIDADTGDQVWEATFLATGLSPLGGGGVGSVAVEGGTLFAFVNIDDAPYAVGLDAGTGAEQWRSTIDSQPGSFVNASPIVVNGMVFAGFSGNEGEMNTYGGYTIFDGLSGATLARRYTASGAEWGASVWATSAADPGSGYVYAATGNPGSAQPDTKNANSLLKIDVRGTPTSNPTFGDIVAAYRGNPDQYLDGVDDQPACEQAPLDDTSDPTTPDDPNDKLFTWSPTCAQLDLDFGASPNLFADGSGHVLVGALQKSGVYHTAYADTMARAWTAPIGAPGASFNAASTATSADAVYAIGTPPSTLFSLAPRTGRPQWASPVADGVHYQSISTAGGVVFTVDGFGFLDMWDGKTGLPLARRPIYRDTGGNAPNGNVGSSGVAIARHLVVAAVAGTYVAYRLPT
jgi:outer membrane protein assembly factor BamB